MLQISFQDVVVLWKADKRKWVKPSTYAVYIQITNKHILPFFGSIKPEELSEKVIQRFADGLLAQGLSVHSIRDIDDSENDSAVRREVIGMATHPL